eukprot:83769_1
MKEQIVESKREIMRITKQLVNEQLQTKHLKKEKRDWMEKEKQMQLQIQRLNKAQKIEIMNIEPYDCAKGLVDYEPARKGANTERYSVTILQIIVACFIPTVILYGAVNWKGVISRDRQNQ